MTWPGSLRRLRDGFGIKPEHPGLQQAYLPPSSTVDTVTGYPHVLPVEKPGPEKVASDHISVSMGFAAAGERGCHSLNTGPGSQGVLAGRRWFSWTRPSGRFLRAPGHWVSGAGAGSG